MLTESQEKAIAMVLMALLLVLFVLTASGVGVAAFDSTLADIPAVQIACGGGNGGGC